MRFLRRVRRSIENLGPYSSLMVLAVPMAIVEPLKIAAVFIFGSGHWITGTIAIVCAYALSILALNRLFRIVKPKLLTLPWFAAPWNWFVAVRNYAMSWLRAKWMPVRKALEL